MSTTRYYCLTCSRRVGTAGRICKACAYKPPKSKVRPKHGLEGGEWVPNARGILEYRILPPKPVAVWPPERAPKSPKLCLICDGKLPPANRSYCSDDCRLIGQRKRRAEYRLRQGMVPRKPGRRRAADTRAFPVWEMRAAHLAYQKGDRSDWAREGRRQYRRTRRQAARKDAA